MGRNSKKQRQQQHRSPPRPTVVKHTRNLKAGKAFSDADAVKLSKRKGPPLHARALAAGITHLGNDGKIWIVRKSEKTGIHSWKPYSGH